MITDPDDLLPHGPSLWERLATRAIEVAAPRPEQLDASTLAAERSLEEFVVQAWHTVEPTTPMTRGWVMGCICAHLEAVTAGEIRDLIVCVPPGTSKSLLGCVMWPSWVWTKDPSSRWIFGAYGQGLAFRDSDRMRDVISSEWYRARWGNLFDFKRSWNTKERFSNTRGGYRISTTVGGKAMGERAGYLCLPYSQRILTDKGWLPIGRIVEEGMRPLVATWNEDLDSLQWRMITRTYRRVCNREDCIVDDDSKTLYDVTTANGKRVRLTGNHPVYVIGKGYVPAAELTVGQRVLTCEAEREVLPVRQGVLPAAGTPGAGEARLLFPHMSWRGSDRCGEPLLCGRESQVDMRCVWQGVQGRSSRCRTGEVLLSCVCRDSQQGSEPCTGCSPRGDGMRVVWQDVTDLSTEGRQAELLRQGVCGLRASWCTGGGEKRTLRSRTVSGRISSRVQLVLAGEDQKTGWLLSVVRARLCRLQGTVEVSHAGPPHRRRQEQQRHVEPDYPLSVMSHARSRWRSESATLGSQVEGSTVVAVARVGCADVVYDLEVEGEHNFFAEGVLVHNCYDDCLKPTDAGSDAMRMHANRSWTQTMSTRGGDPRSVKKVVIGQRLHERDLPGYLMSEVGGYETLILPMEYEPARYFLPSSPDVRPPRDAIVPTILQRRRPELRDGPEGSGRRFPGDLLWPERFPAEEVEKLKGTLAGVGSAGQLQQRPSAAEGTLFKAQDFRHFTVESDADGNQHAVLGVRESPDQPEPLRIPVDFLRFFQTIDTALTNTPTSAYTCVITFAWHLPSRNLLVWDVWRARLEVREQMEAIRQMRQGKGHWDVASRRWAIPGIIRPWPRALLYQAVESKASGYGILQQARADGIPLLELKAIGDKAQRAAPAVTMARNGKLWFRAAAPWLVDFEEEMLSAPYGAWADQYDCACYGAIQANTETLLNAAVEGDLLCWPPTPTNLQGRPLSPDEVATHNPDAEVLSVGGVEIEFAGRDPDAWWDTD